MLTQAWEEELWYLRPVSALAIQPAKSAIGALATFRRPWRFGVNDLEALAEEAGMTIVDNVRTAELHRTYWPSQPLDAIIYDHYSLCTLKPSPAY